MTLGTMAMLLPLESTGVVHGPGQSAGSEHWEHQGCERHGGGYERGSIDSQQSSTAVRNNNPSQPLPHTTNLLQPHKPCTTLHNPQMIHVSLHMYYVNFTLAYAVLDCSHQYTSEQNKWRGTCSSQQTHTVQCT